MPSFPSEAWFEDVRTVFNGDETYHGAGGGRCNCRSAMKVGQRIFLVVFEGLECVETTEVDSDALDSCDFYLEMSQEEWAEMVQDIVDNGGASLHYTLNTLDLAREEGLARSTHNDQYRVDLFYRYNQTFQFFFDASARVATTY